MSAYLVPSTVQSTLNELTLDPQNHHIHAHHLAIELNIFFLKNKHANRAQKKYLFSYLKDFSLLL